MAQMVSRGGLRRNPHGVVTVADLLSRNARSADRAPGHSPGPFLAIPVGSLLRREGRLPRPADGTAGAAKPRLSRTTARRGAVAAGVLLAAGSVLATMALTDVEPVSAVAGEAGDGTGYPGQGLLDRGDALAAAGGTALIGPAALRDALDAGSAAPMTWQPVAFPGATGAPSSGAAAAPGSATTRPPAPAPVDLGPTRVAPAPTTPAPAPAPPAPPSRGTDDPAPGGGLTGTVGGAVRDVGGALPAPVGAPVQQLGGAVAGSEGSATTSSAPQQTAQPSSGVVGGVGRVAAGLLGG